MESWLGLVAMKGLLVLERSGIHPRRGDCRPGEDDYPVGGLTAIRVSLRLVEASRKQSAAMDRSGTVSDPLDRPLKRLAAAVDQLERTADRRMRHDEARASAEEEYALMQDDRSRLAVELDAALDRSRALEAATKDAGERLQRAAQTIERIIGRVEPPAG
jgi:hypothetical protein